MGGFLTGPLFLAAQVLFVVVAFVLLRARVLLSAPTRDGVLLGGLMLGFQPLWLSVANQQVEALFLVALAGALAASTSRQPIAAGALLGLLALRPELFAIVIVVFLVAATDRMRTAVGFIVPAAAIAFIAMLRPDLSGPRLQAVFRFAAPDEPNATIWTVDRFIPGLPANLLPAIVSLSALALFVLWWRRTRPLFDTLVGASLCLSLAIAPHARSTDHVALLVTAAVILELLAHTLQGERSRGIVLVALVAGALPWLLYLPSSLRGAEEWAVFVPICLFALLVLAENWRSRPLGATSRERSEILG